MSVTGEPIESFDIEEGPYEPYANTAPGDKLLSGASPRAAQTGRKRSSRSSEAKVMRIFIAILAVLLLIVIIVILAANMGKSRSRDASAAAPTGALYEDDFNMKQNWGAYSPYFSSGAPFDGVSKHQALSGEYTLPNTCRYSQVHVLHRHGDRYPADKTTELMRTVADKLQNMTEPPTLDSLKWLETWEYALQADLLVGAGVGALFDSGAKFWGSHGRLLYPGAAALPAWTPDINLWDNGTARPKPVLRGTDQQRIQDSARAWAAGFFGTYAYPSSGTDPLDQYSLVLMPEAENSNNSLAGYYACPNADKKHATNGGERSRIWVDTYLADAATRIQKVLPGYSNLTASEVLGLQDLCVFETAAFGSSAFCELFTEQEWRGFEYHIDLKFYGDSAWGSPVAPATGVPWLAELRARLNSQLISEPGHGVNVTLDSSAASFPLEQPFYADFTHDSTISAVLAALQFPFTKSDLSPHKIKIPRQFIVSRLTPFAARLYVEVLECGSSANTAYYVRLKLNDRVLPLNELKHCHADDQDGLCPLADFVRSLDWALSHLDFDDTCYGDHKYKKYEP